MKVSVNDNFTLSKKTIGRPRKTDPRPSEFSVWLRDFMSENALTVENVSAACHVTKKAVYGWLSGTTPENSVAVKTMLIAIYERVPAVSEGRDAPPERGQQAGQAAASSLNREAETDASLRSPKRKTNSKRKKSTVQVRPRRGSGTQRSTGTGDTRPGAQ